MDLGLVLLLVAAGGFLVWRMRKDQEPAIIGEVILALRNHAALRHKDFSVKYERMAEGLGEAQAYVARGDRPMPDELRRLTSAVAGATEPDLLENLGFFHASGRQGRAREALFGLMKKLAR